MPTLGGLGPDASVISRVMFTTARASSPRPSDGALRHALPLRTRSKITIAARTHDPATTGNRMVSMPEPLLAAAYANATPPPATRRRRGANHQALRCCVWVAIVEATMMAQPGARLHHPTGVM